MLLSSFLLRNATLLLLCTLLMPLIPMGFTRARFCCCSSFRPTGTIPKELCYMEELRILRIDYNKFTSEQAPLTK